MLRVIGLVCCALLIASNAFPALGRPSSELLSITPLDGLTLTSPQPVVQPAAVAFGDSICALWSVAKEGGRRDTTFLATSRNGRAWDRKRVLSTPGTVDARLLRAGDVAYAVVGDGPWLTRIRPNLTRDSLLSLECPRSHAGWGMDVLLEHSTVWAAYDLAGANAQGKATQFVLLVRSPLGGGRSSVTTLDSLPSREGNNMLVQLSRRSTGLRVVAAKHPSIGAEPSGGSLRHDDRRGDTLVVYDQLADGKWRSKPLRGASRGSPKLTGSVRERRDDLRTDPGRRRYVRGRNSLHPGTGQGSTSPASHDAPIQSLGSWAAGSHRERSRLDMHPRLDGDAPWAWPLGADARANRRYLRRRGGGGHSLRSRRSLTSVSCFTGRRARV